MKFIELVKLYRALLEFTRMLRNLFIILDIKHTKQSTWICRSIGWGILESFKLSRGPLVKFFFRRIVKELCHTK